MTISGELKTAIKKSGQTVYEIAKASGITESAIHRFLSDDPKTHRDIRLEATADRLAEYLGLKLIGKAAVKKAPKK